MNARMLTKVEARFSTQEQKSCLVLQELEDGTFDAYATYERVGSGSFPRCERMRREGKVFRFDAEALVGAMLVITDKGWYHHYLGNSSFEDRAQWLVRMSYDDGSQRRWEGRGDAPKGLDTVYELLVSFGMPALYQQSAPTIADMSRAASEDGNLKQLTCYDQLFDNLLLVAEGDELRDKWQLLTDEFVEDIKRYLRAYHPDLDLHTAYEVWGIDPSPQALCELPVDDAPRMKMLTLFGALTKMENPGEVVAAMTRGGAMGRWCSRLICIPYDEHIEREQERRDRHHALLLSVDDALRKRIAGGKVFTSYEVATEMGLTPQQVSTRIRRLVRAGELQAVGEGYPRRYKAA